MNDRRDRLKEKLSEKLLEYMRQHNLSTRQLAVRLKISPTSVGSYLDHTAYPGEEIRRYKIAPLLGLTFDELQAQLGEDVEFVQRPVDQLCQEVRTLEEEEFLIVARVVLDRLYDGFGNRNRSSSGTKSS